MLVVPVFAWLLAICLVNRHKQLTRNTVQAGDEEYMLREVMQATACCIKKQAASNRAVAGALTNGRNKGSANGLTQLLVRSEQMTSVICSERKADSCGWDLGTIIDIIDAHNPYCHSHKADSGSHKAESGGVTKLTQESES